MFVLVIVLCLIIPILEQQTRDSGSHPSTGRQHHRRTRPNTLDNPKVRYSHVAAGGRHTLLLLSDGSVAACGSNEHGQCDLPAAEAGITYLPAAGLGDLLISLSVEACAVGHTVTCQGLVTGSILVAWVLEPAELGTYVMPRLIAELSRPGARLRVVLREGSFLPVGPCTWAGLLPG